ncbi:MAG: EAL domain-containing protein [Burkholderiaceae bacterium]|nr:EAL domain-containing protein [Burkholderiaceae bacterium]
MESEVLLGRQPILDATGSLVAFELLFRASSSGARTGWTDDLHASSHVMARVLADIGLGASLGRFTGFVNVDRDLLMSEMVELLPPERFVLEILETTEIDDELGERILALRARGYRFALDDVIAEDDGRLDRLALVDIVKIDFMPGSRWQDLARLLKPTGKKLLAEKVETPEQFRQAREAGFDLFQGFFFAKPHLLHSRRIPSAAHDVIRLIAMLDQDPDIDDVARELRRHPALFKPILRLVNSSAAGMSREIDSISTAIALVGLRQIARLAQLMLYADGDSPPTRTDPLVQQAGLRARMMELLARQWRPDEAHMGDQAFLTGVLSQLDVLFGLPLKDVTAGLPLVEGVRDALLDRAGPLGQLLSVCEARERADLPALEALCGTMGGIDIAHTVRAEIEAAAWMMAQLDSRPG